MKTLPLARFTKEIIALMPDLIRGMIKGQTDEIARGHLTMPQYLVMDLVLRHKALKMSELAHLLHVSLPAMTGIVDRLYAMKMVSRRLDSSDRRIVRVVLKPKGARVVRKVRRQRESLVKRVFGQLTAGERNDYLNILRKVKDVLEKNI